MTSTQDITAFDDCTCLVGEEGSVNASDMLMTMQEIELKLARFRTWNPIVVRYSEYVDEACRQYDWVTNQIAVDHGANARLATLIVVPTNEVYRERVWWF